MEDILVAWPLIRAYYADPSDDYYCRDGLLDGPHSLRAVEGLWKVFALTLLSTGLVYGALNTAVKHQQLFLFSKGKVWPRVLSCLLTWA